MTVPLFLLLTAHMLFYLDGFMEGSGNNISLLFGSKLDEVYCVT